MDLKIKEVSIEGERVFLKKSKVFGWGIVNPIKVDGKINWKNLIAGGSWFRLGFIALFVVLFALATLEYTNAVKLANECLQGTGFLNYLP